MWTPRLHGGPLIPVSHGDRPQMEACGTPISGPSDYLFLNPWSKEQRLEENGGTLPSQDMGQDSGPSEWGFSNCLWGPGERLNWGQIQGWVGKPASRTPLFLYLTFQTRILKLRELQFEDRDLIVSPAPYSLLLSHYCKCGYMAQHLRFWTEGVGWFVLLLGEILTTQP